MIVSGFGATGVTGADCPAGGDWSAWCDCAFPAGVDPANNTKCRSWRPGAPWTVVGAMLRGIPQMSSGGTAAGTGSSILATITGLFSSGGAASQSAPVTAPTDDGLFGVPKMVALVGGGVLVLGVGAYFATRKRPAKRRAWGAHRPRRTRRR